MALLAPFLHQMHVFRPWTLQFFEFCFQILQEASKYPSPKMPIIDTGRCKLATRGTVVGVEREKSGFWCLDSGNLRKSKVISIETCSVVLPTTMPIIGTAVAGNPGPEVGVEHQKSVKMQVFRL